MHLHEHAPIHVLGVLVPILVGLIFIGLMSLFKEPHRRQFMAIMIAGAGAAYLGGGLGPWEFVFTAVVTVCAYKGLSDYRFIGISWLLHSA